MIRIADFDIEETFPAVVRSKKKFNVKEFIQQISEHKLPLHQLLLKHGALLFRGFPVTDAATFSEVIESLGLGKFVNYIGGDSPRDKVEKKVYTSTEAPPSFYIPLHQELSFIKNFPKHIYFFCEVAAPVGGATIIGNARKVYEMMDADIKHKFEEKQLRYSSHYYYKSKIMTWVNKMQRSHKSWIEVFETNNKHDVEKKCIENEFDWRWLKRDWIEIKQTRPAVYSHPETQESVWFNQAHLYDFNPRLLGWKNYIGATLFYFRKETRLHEIAFGDGTRIPRKELYHVMDVLNENTVAYPWQAGDVMVLDNVLTMHGRASFEGKRRVLTAMTS